MLWNFDNRSAITTYYTTVSFVVSKVVLFMLIVGINCHLMHELK